MKKLIILILGVLFIIPLSVKADMGPPMIKEYKATPISKDGAKYYDSIYSDTMKVSGTFSYNKELIVSEEEKKDGKIYVLACDKEEDICGHVLVSDLKLTKGATDLSSYKVKYQGRVFANDGVEVYEGPGYIYKKTGKKIPGGAEIITSSYEGNEGTWLKVKYKDIEGFVDSDNSSVMVLYTGMELIKETNKIVDEFYLSNPWNSTFAYKKDGKYVVTKESTDILSKFDYTTNEFKALKNINLYKYFEYDYENVTPIATIEKGETVKFIYDAAYQGDGIYYVDYNGTKGWIQFIYSEGNEYFDGYDYEKIYEYKDKINGYVVNRPVEATENSTADDEPATGDAITPDQKEEKKNDKGEKLFAGFTKNQIILISSIGAGVIVLTSIVTMILVNKKKNKNNSVQE